MGGAQVRAEGDAARQRPGEHRRTADRGEFHKAKRTGKPAARAELHALVQDAARAAGRTAAWAGWRDETFFAELAKRDVVQLRYSSVNLGEVTGYSVGLPGDLTAEGKPRMYGGSKLDRNLSLPRLRGPVDQPGDGTRAPDENRDRQDRAAPRGHRRSGGLPYR